MLGVWDPLCSLWQWLELESLDPKTAPHSPHLSLNITASPSTIGNVDPELVVRRWESVGPDNERTVEGGTELGRSVEDDRSLAVKLPSLLSRKNGKVGQEMVVESVDIDSSSATIKVN